MWLCQTLPAAPPVWSLTLSLSLSFSLSPSQTWPYQGWSHVSSISLADAVHPEGIPWILPRLDRGRPQSMGPQRSDTTKWLKVHTCTQLLKESFFFFLQNIKGLHLFSQGSLLIIWYLNHPLIKLKLCPRPTRMKACIFCRMCNFTSLQSICIWFALYCWPRGSVQQRSWCLVWGSTHQHNGKLLNVN